MATEKIFDINEHGVCMNPNTQSVCKGLFRATIKTAKIEGFWYYGYDFMTATSGNGCGVTKSDRQRYDKESEAIEEAARRGIDFFRRETDTPKFIFDELEKMTKPQPVQLSLFDF